MYIYIYIKTNMGVSGCTAPESSPGSTAAPTREARRGGANYSYYYHIIIISSSSVIFSCVSMIITIDIDMADYDYYYCLLILLSCI